MSYFILGISGISYYNFYALWYLPSSNLTSVINKSTYFYISTILFYHYMKNLFPNIYLLNKQDLNAHFNET